LSYGDIVDEVRLFQSLPSSSASCLDISRHSLVEDSPQQIKNNIKTWIIPHGS